MSTYFEFEVSLLEIKPRIWRSFQLLASSNFEMLHNAIQDAFGWQRKHLYEFRHFYKTTPGIKTPVKRIARCKQAEILDDEIVPFTNDLQIDSFFAENNDCCLYLYDFGDGWQHLVELKNVLETQERFTRRLVDGSMECPPENCGGPIGYEEMLDHLSMTDERIAKLDEAERPEIEWLRKKYRGWKSEAFDLVSAKVRLDS